MTDSFEQPELLTTKNFILRKAQADDFDNLYLAASDPLVWEQHPSQRHIKSVFSEWFELAMQHGNALIILDKDNNQVIGTTRFYDFNEQEQSIAIGYTFLKREYWGNGANQEIKEYLLDYAFHRVNRVWLHIAPTNTRSRSAAEKIGAVYSHLGYIQNTPLEHCFYYIDNSEWHKST